MTLDQGGRNALFRGRRVGASATVEVLLEDMGDCRFVARSVPHQILIRVSSRTALSDWRPVGRKASQQATQPGEVGPR
jgi:hypothetical protein